MKKLTVSVVLMVLLIMFSTTAYADDCPQTSAKAMILIDATTGDVIASKNSDTKLPMASTTKIMSALLALEFTDDLDKQFTVDKNAIKVEGSSMGLKEGDKVTMRDLVCGMLLPSGNDAANAAAVRISGSVENFVALMNERAAEMGLNSTHFVTPSGLDDNTDEHYSTAKDMAELARQALKNPEFQKICSSANIKVKFGNPPYERWLTNSNKLLQKCEGVIGVKTGFTDKARRCLVSACKRNGGTLICVTLNDPDDWLDHSNLYEYGFKQLEKITIPLESKSISVNVVGGEKDTVKCVTEPLTLTIPKNSANKITSQVYIYHFLYAPVTEDTIVGEIRYYCNGEYLCSRSITTADKVNRQNL
ncbi:MAG: D-alanyl-D-alanine carboxypeptidase family protein [Oscillospiraceae bacterium]